MTADEADVELDVEVRAKTDAAILVYDGKITAWIPKSQISDYTGEDIDEAESIFIPEWLAFREGFL